MLGKAKAIVLSNLKYKDNDLIIKCYTNQRGVVTYLQKGALKMRKGKSNAVYYQPLMLLEIVENYQPTRSLQYLKEFKCYFPYRSLHTNIYKASLAVFLSEILANVLQEEEANEGLFEFLEAAFQFLDGQQQFANFHLIFLLRLSKYLGFYPEKEATKKHYFNMESGLFEDQKTSIYSLEGTDKDLLVQLLNSDFERVANIQLNAAQRSNFLKELLLYFELHLGTFRKPRSLQVFNEVFH
jgi:DNA repair protein RecO (recombination protein O)